MISRHTTASAVVLLLLAVSTAQAAVDLKNIPATFCQAPLEASGNTASCNDNNTFISAARDCYKKLNALETQLGTEAAAIAAKNTNAQHGQTLKGQAEYQFSVAVFAYLLQIASVAQGELKEYQTYVAPPPDNNFSRSEDPSNPYAWFDEIPCWGETHAELRKTRQDFADKSGRYLARMNEAKKMQAGLGKNATQLGALGAAKAANTQGKAASGMPAVNTKPKTGPSDITGVKEDKSKQKKLIP